MLVDKDKNMRKDKNVAEIMNNYSVNITKHQKILTALFISHAS